MPSRILVFFEFYIEIHYKKITLKYAEINKYISEYDIDRYTSVILNWDIGYLFIKKKEIY